MVLLILVSFWLIADDIFLALNKATDINFSERSKEENAARILKWNLNKCPKIIYTGSEYGEATVTVKCSNGKAYLLSFNDLHHVTDFLDVYDWDIDEIDFNTLKYNLGNSFEEWCLQRTGLSAEARKTVEVLLEEAGTSDCELAAKNLSSRTGLSLSITQITDIRPLAGFTNLTTLVLSGNQIKDISPLAGLTNLTVLYLSGNQITDVSLLAGLTKLTVLSLSDNQIADISPLAGLTNLTELNLKNNQIKDISPLAKLTNLYGLYLTSNPLSQPVCPVSPPDVCQF